MQSTLPPRPNPISFTVNMKENNDQINRRNNLTPQSHYQNIYGNNNEKASDMHNDRRPYTLEANVISPKFLGFQPNNNNNTNSTSQLNINNSL